MIKKALTTAAILGSVLFSQAAEAYTTYGRFNAGSLRINKATVTNSTGRTRMIVNMTMPTCGRRYYLYGRVYATFRSKDGGYFRNKSLGFFDSRRVNYEGATITRTAYGKYRINTYGRVQVSHNLTCKHLGITRDTLKNADPTNRNSRLREGLRKLDPTTWQKL